MGSPFGGSIRANTYDHVAPRTFKNRPAVSMVPRGCPLDSRTVVSMVRTAPLDSSAVGSRAAAPSAPTRALLSTRRTFNTAGSLYGSQAVPSRFSHGRPGGHGRSGCHRAAYDTRRGRLQRLHTDIHVASKQRQGSIAWRILQDADSSGAGTYVLPTRSPHPVALWSQPRSSSSHAGWNACT